MSTVAKDEAAYRGEEGTCYDVFGAEKLCKVALSWRFRGYWGVDGLICIVFDVVCEKRLRWVSIYWSCGHYWGSENWTGNELKAWTARQNTDLRKIAIQRSPMISGKIGQQMPSAPSTICRQMHFSTCNHDNASSNPLVNSLPIDEFTSATSEISIAMNVVDYNHWICCKLNSKLWLMSQWDYCGWVSDPGPKYD